LLLFGIVLFSLCDGQVNAAAVMSCKVRSGEKRNRERCLRIAC
jgi:hypothetical protein